MFRVEDGLPSHSVTWNTILAGSLKREKMDFSVPTETKCAFEFSWLLSADACRKEEIYWELWCQFFTLEARSLTSGAHTGHLRLGTLH